MISLLAFLFIVGVVISVHEFGHFIMAKKIGVRVEEFFLGFGPQLILKKKNSTKYGINLIPLGGYVKLAGDSLQEYKGSSDEYLYKSPGERAKVILCGPLFNYILGFFCFWLIFAFFASPMLTNKVGGLVDGFGAEEAGIQAGDVIVAIDSEKMNFWEDIQGAIQNKKPGTYVNVSFLRENKLNDLKVLIKDEILKDVFGQKRSTALLGIKPVEEFIKVRHGFLSSFKLAVNKTWNLTAMTYRALGLMIVGKLSLRDSLAGPLGFLYITSKYAREGMVAILHLLGVLSINLCIFNLLPLPVLDGGHLTLLGVEKIRGRALGKNSELIVTRIGFTILIVLAVIATGIDLMRFMGENPLLRRFLE